MMDWEVFSTAFSYILCKTSNPNEKCTQLCARLYYLRYSQNAVQPIPAMYTSASQVDVVRHYSMDVPDMLLVSG